MGQFDKAFTQFTQANVPGQFQQGRQFTQKNQQAAQQQAQSQFNLDQSRKLAPIQFQQQQAQLTGSQQLNEKRDRVAVLTRNLDTVLQLKATPDNQKAEFLTSKIAEGEAKGRDMTESMKALELVNQGRFEELSQGGDQLISIGERSGLIQREGGAVSASDRGFDRLISGFSPEDQVIARRVKAGVTARAGSSSTERIAQDPTLSTQVARSKAEIKQAEKFAEATGSSRAKTIDSGFEKIQKINTGISNIDRAIAALESGAGVGAIEKFLPSFKASSVELDNIQKSMALDVIGSVTFGALSQGELNLAKDVALPTGLDTPQLIDYLNRRKVAQEKLRDYFSEQIQFLDQGGTVAGFLRSKEGGQQQDQPQQESNDLSPEELAELAELERKFGGQ